MAKVSHISYERFEAEVDLECVSWRPAGLGRYERLGQAPKLPIIFFETGQPWTAANLWLAEKYESVVSGDLSILSVHHNASGLCSYLKFLEHCGFPWDLSTERRSDHPTSMYRKHLLRARDERQLAPSTASARMACVANFYRWAHSTGLLDRSPLTSASHEVLIGADRYGLIRRRIVRTTDLHIRRKRTHPLPSIAGLSPVSEKARAQILEIANETCSEEFALMLTLGFATGMRLRSILDLKLETLEAAIPGEVEGISYLQIGPRHGVATKFSINGHALIPTALLQRLQLYGASLRRARRAIKATPRDRKLLFLNRFGKPYGQRDRDKSPSVNVDMVRIRAAAKLRNVDLSGFYFHCTRATFGTSIVVSGMRTEGVSLESIICRLTELLMHRDEATSLRYVKYLEGRQLIATHEASYSAWLFAGAIDGKA